MVRCEPEAVVAGVYVLYLLAPFFLLAPAIFGVWLAYSFRDQGASWVRTHFRYQISLFWRGFRHTGAILAVGAVGTCAFVFGHAKNAGAYANVFELLGAAILLYGGFALFLLFSLACTLCLDVARAIQGLLAWNLRHPIGFGPGARGRARATLNALETLGTLLFVLFVGGFFARLVLS